MISVVLIHERGGGGGGGEILAMFLIYIYSKNRSSGVQFGNNCKVTVHVIA